MRHSANKTPPPALGVFSPLRYAVFRRIWTASLLSNLGLLVLGVGAAWAMTKISSSTGMVALVQTSLMLPVALVSTEWPCSDRPGRRPSASKYQQRRCPRPSRSMASVTTLPAALGPRLAALSSRPRERSPRLDRADAPAARQILRKTRTATENISRMIRGPSPLIAPPGAPALMSFVADAAFDMRQYSVEGPVAF